MTPLLGHLTDREEEVLALIADGHGLREIAQQLEISRWTARDHRDSARRKLGASTQAQAVAILVAERSRAIAR